MTQDNANHDAAPAARANAESVAPQPTAGDRSGNPTSHSGTGNTWSLQWESDRPKPVKDDVSDRSKPIGDDRLAALEQLSAMDQELEERHGLQGNPMIKAQGRTPQPHATTAQGSVQGDGSFRDARNAKEPVAWAVVSDSTEQIDCEFVYPDEATAGDVALDSNGGVVPLYRQPSPTLTAAEREAVLTAAWEADAHQHAQRAATLRGLLERFGGER